MTYGRGIHRLSGDERTIQARTEILIINRTDTLPFPLLYFLSVRTLPFVL